MCYVYDNLSVSGIYMAVDNKGNICMAVGLEGSKAVIITGKKYYYNNSDEVKLPAASR
jgi:hypothetical protein